MHAHSTAPSAWIVRFAHLVAPGARVLDVASGAGRHARFFAARGCRVLAIDRDADVLGALAGVANVDVAVTDLESGAPWPFPGQRFDAVVVANYLHRPLFVALRDALAPGGALLYETFAEGNERHGRPANPDFLLRRDELLTAFGPDLTIVAFEQGEVHEAGRIAVVERIAAVAPRSAWPAVLVPPPG